MPNARIIGTGSYLPRKVLTNADLEKLVDTSDEWIQSRTGICTRHMAADDEATSDLAYHASVAALQMGNLDPADLDMILVATATPDHVFPSTACLLQDRLGAKKAGGLDISAACSGFVYGVGMAHGLIQSGTCRTVLVVGAETLTRVVNWQDRNTCVLFGDGAGAALLRAEEGDRGVLSVHMRSDGSKGAILIIPGGGSRHPVSHSVVDEGLAKIQMNAGNEVFKLAVRAMEEVALAALKQAGLEVGDVDHIISHQANLRIISALGQRLGLPDHKVVVNVQRVGNTSAATIPLAMDEAVRDGRIQPGHLVLLCAFGGGLTWGSALVRW
jgi:3-oxoacyl-[acyl-carrier-protein] synthase III